MEASNGDSRENHLSSSRRDDYSSSRRKNEYYEHRLSSSRHEDRYERYRDRDRTSNRDRDRERRYQDSEESSHHRGSHRDRDYGSSSRGDYGSSSHKQGSHGPTIHDDYPTSRERASRYDSRRGSSRFDGAKSSGGYGDRGRDRQRSASPKRNRGSSPDLTGVAPIDVRKRRLTMWDVKPPGYEHVTAEQAKMSGLFPLPGAPRNPQQFSEEGLSALAQGIPPPSGPAGSTLAPLEVPKLWALDAHNSRQSRRIVVAKLPPSSTGAEIQNVFNALIESLNIYDRNSGEPVKDVKKATSGGIAMVEFSTSSYATVVLALEDEIEFNGVQLEVRRPAGYIVQPPEQDSTLSSDKVNVDVPDSTEKLVIKGLPVYLTNEQGLELVEAFGAVQSWFLLSEIDSSETKVLHCLKKSNNEGIAFLQYKNPTITPIALEALNGMQLNEEHNLSVSLACVGYKQTERATQNAGGAMGMINDLAAKSWDVPQSRVILLLNMVTGEDLMDADEYDEILQDVTEQCEKFGKVLDIQVPRPLGRSGEGPGVGKVFVRFENAEGCAAALKGLAGRKYQERTIVASYYPEDNYEMSAW